MSANCWRDESGSDGTGDCLFGRLRSLERKDAPDEDYRLMIENFYQSEPAVRAAMPQFSTFGLIEAIRASRHRAQPLCVGRFAATTAAAVEVLRELSPEDVTRCHPLYSPNHPHFDKVAALFGGLFFGVAVSTTAPGAAVPVGLAGAVCCFLIASLLRFHVRNSAARAERPQWICALHVDRYLQAHHRGESLREIRLENLPNPGFRRKAPFYDLHNQIMSGRDWVFKPHLKETPHLEFTKNAPIHED